jgi:biotin operon repressor
MEDVKNIAKKVIIVYILNVIKAYSSPESPVSQTAICNYLNDIDVPCDRKTVGRNIEYLCEFGYPIKKVAGKGYYLTEEDIKKCKNKLII